MISGSIRWFHITIHIAVSIDETAVTTTYLLILFGLVYQEALTE